MSDELPRPWPVAPRRSTASTPNCSSAQPARACAQKVGAIKAEHSHGRIYRPSARRGCAVCRKRIPVRCSGENIYAFFFREVIAACLALEEPLGIAFLSRFRHLFRIGGDPSTSVTQRACCRRFSRSTTYSARSIRACAIRGGAGHRRTRPKARSAARSTCCWRRRSGFAASWCCAFTSTCCPARRIWARSPRSIRTPSRWHSATNG